MSNIFKYLEYSVWASRPSVEVHGRCFWYVGIKSKLDWLKY